MGVETIHDLLTNKTNSRQSQQNKSWKSNLTFFLLISPRGECGPIPAVVQNRANPWPGRGKPLFHGRSSKNQINILAARWAAFQILFWKEQILHMILAKRPRSDTHKVFPRIMQPPQWHESHEMPWCHKRALLLFANSPHTGNIGGAKYTATLIVHKASACTKTAIQPSVNACYTQVHVNSEFMLTLYSVAWVGSVCRACLFLFSRALRQWTLQTRKTQHSTRCGMLITHKNCT